MIHDPSDEWHLAIEYGLSRQLQIHDSLLFLRAFYINGNEAPICFQKTFNIQKHDPVHRDHFISIGPTTLSLSEACGFIKNDHDSVAWEISFEDPVENLRLAPGPIKFYQNLFHKFRILSPRLKTMASGHVHIGHRKHNLRNLQIYQGHSYGIQVPQQMAHLCCIHFDNHPDSFFEFQQISTSKNTIGPQTINLLGFNDGDYVVRDWGFNLNKSRTDQNSWFNQIVRHRYKWEFLVKWDPQNEINQNLFPGNKQHYLKTQLKADFEMSRFIKTKNTWELDKTLTSSKVFFKQSHLQQIEDQT